SEVTDGKAEAAVLLPDGLEALPDSLPEGERDGDGGSAPFEVQFISTDAGIGPQLRSIVQDAIARASAPQVAVALAVSNGADEEAARDAAAALGDRVATIEVRTVTTGDRLFP